MRDNEPVSRQTLAYLARITLALAAFAIGIWGLWTILAERSALRGVDWLFVIFPATVLYLGVAILIRAKRLYDGVTRFSNGAQSLQREVIIGAGLAVSFWLMGTGTSLGSLSWVFVAAALILAALALFQYPAT